MFQTLSFILFLFISFPAFFATATVDKCSDGFTPSEENLRTRLTGSLQQLLRGMQETQSKELATLSKALPFPTADTLQKAHRFYALSHQQLTKGVITPLRESQRTFYEAAQRDPAFHTMSSSAIDQMEYHLATVGPGALPAELAYWASVHLFARPRDPELAEALEDVLALQKRQVVVTEILNSWDLNREGMQMVWRMAPDLESAVQNLLAFEVQTHARYGALFPHESFEKAIHLKEERDSQLLIFLRTMHGFKTRENSEKVPDALLVDALALVEKLGLPASYEPKKLYAHLTLALASNLSPLPYEHFLISAFAPGDAPLENMYSQLKLITELAEHQSMGTLHKAIEQKVYQIQFDY